MSPTINVDAESAAKSSILSQLIRIASELGPKDDTFRLFLQISTNPTSVVEILSKSAWITDKERATIKTNFDAAYLRLDHEKLESRNRVQLLFVTTEALFANLFKSMRARELASPIKSLVSVDIKPTGYIIEGLPLEQFDSYLAAQGLNRKQFETTGPARYNTSEMRETKNNRGKAKVAFIPMADSVSVPTLRLKIDKETKRIGVESKGRVHAEVGTGEASAVGVKNDMTATEQEDTEDDEADAKNEYVVVELSDGELSMINGDADIEVTFDKSRWVSNNKTTPPTAGFASHVSKTTSIVNALLVSSLETFGPSHPTLSTLTISIADPDLTFYLLKTSTYPCPTTNSPRTEKAACAQLRIYLSFIFSNQHEKDQARLSGDLLNLTSG
ncbi:hypothetical protein LTR66_016624 [Elasticomyces elasticus]|nr:hypothetical protein LTR66_016624 [Elasticomyces elasticus]